MSTATVDIEESKKNNVWRQKLFMRKIRFGKGSCIDEWPRREGKSHTLKQLVKPMFKRQHKKTQILRGAQIGKKVKVIRKDTKVVIVDDVSKTLVNLVKFNRPDVRVVGLYSEVFDRNPKVDHKLAEKNVLFEK